MTEAPEVVRTIESKFIYESALSQKDKRAIGERVVSWLQKSFSKDATAAVVNKERNPRSLEVYNDLVAKQQDLAIALHVLSAIDPEGELHSDVKRELLDSGRPTSLANSLKRKNASTPAEVFILGSVSSNTLHYLNRAAYPKIEPEIESSLPEFWVDSLKKGDMEVEAGEKDGVVYRNIVQIKSDPYGIVDLMQIDGEHSDYLGVSKKDAHTLKEYVDELNTENRKTQDGKKIVYRPFVALVPAYDSKPVNNLYGIITDNKVVEEFKQRAAQTGYFIEEAK